MSYGNYGYYTNYYSYYKDYYSEKPHTTSKKPTKRNKFTDFFDKIKKSYFRHLSGDVKRRR